MNDHARCLCGALDHIHHRPEPFAAYTAQALWDDDHISEQMLAFHLDPSVEPASRPHEFIRRSADWIVDRFSIGDGTRVADFGCGPGLYSTRFAEAGATVTGIDFSRRSITHARAEAGRRDLPIDYVLGNYLEYDTDVRFDLITLIYCDLCALSPGQRQRLLASFRRLLARGGSILLDVSTETAFAKREESSSHERRFMGGFWAPGDYWGFLNTFKYDDARVVLDKFDIVEPHRMRTIYNWLQYFSIETLDAEVAQCGLRVVERYGDVAGAPETGDTEVMAVVLEEI